MSAEVVVMVGGEAGQGVQSVGTILTRTLHNGGLTVFADQDYESRVRGGHNFFRIRASNESVKAVSEKIDMLVALNRETLEIHRRELTPDGIVIYDVELTGGELVGKNYFNVPLAKLARDTAGNTLMINSVAAGAVIGLGKAKFDILANTLSKVFGRYGEKVVKDNVAAAKAGYEHARKTGPGRALPSMKVTADTGKRLILTGNDALALGAMAAGCRFIAGYPMTPASSIMEYMAENGQDYGVVSVHVEDEISAINMAVGAGFTGVRSMVATSGGGFALMVEGLSLAGITETPVVAVLGQRPGPATGLPTRTEQGELWFALHAGHGEFPRAVLTPATVEEMFAAPINAFNLAEKYQTPVIILTDHHLATSFASVKRFDLGKVNIDRGELIPDEALAKYKEYHRHLVTRSGVSPRALPGQGKALVVTDSDEHDEDGHMIEEAAIRNRQVEKRMRKARGIRRDSRRPQHRKNESAVATLVGWGSTCGAVQEAAARLTDNGLPVNTLLFNQVWPFPSTTVKTALDTDIPFIVVEGNATGQLERLIRRETGLEARATMLRYDGRPHTPTNIAKRVRKEVSTW